MTITRVGTTKRYAEGWDAAFNGKRGKRASSAAAASKTAKKKQAAGRVKP